MAGRWLTLEVRDLNGNTIATCPNTFALRAFISFTELHAIPRGAFVVWAIDASGEEEEVSADS